MQADEEVGVTIVSEGDPIREGQFSVIGASKKNLPAIRREQRFQSPGPIQCEFLLGYTVDDICGAAVRAAMSWIDHDHSIITQHRRRSFNQRLDVLLHIQSMDEQLVANE